MRSTVTEEISELREKQIRLEQSTEDIASTVKQLATIQQRQQTELQDLASSISDVSSDVKSLLSSLHSREGRLDLKTFVPVLGLLLAIMAGLGGWFLQPIQTTANSLTIKPIRNARNDQTLVYDPTSGEVTYTNYVKTISTTVASLVAASTVGSGTRAFVTDANTTTFLAIVGGGGANKVPVVSDGTNWIVG